MGANQSGGVSIGGSSMGYQVLRVYPNSPGSEAGLKAYFDFVVGIGTTRFDKEDGSLREILKASVDQKIKMIVYNTRSKTAREVDVVPTTRWGGSGLLGVSIKHSSFDRADERVWHVVEVDPGSPAHQAGFKANEDFVIGSDSVLQENDDLYNLIEAHENRALKLFVYNTKSDNCREVICHPNSKWGGRGYMGCEFGHGLLHRIPYADSQHAAPDLPTNDPRQPLINQQQQQHQQQQQQHVAPQTKQPTFSPSTFQNQAMLQQSQRSNQPGYQLLQQALFDKSPMQQSSTMNSQSTDRLPPPPVHPQAPQHQQQQAPPQVPQTFAQLASAQYQVSHNQQLEQQQHQHHQQPQQQQQQQKEDNQQQMLFNQQQQQQQQSPVSTNQNNSMPPPFEPPQYPKFDQQTGVQQNQQQQPQQLPQSYNSLMSSDDGDVQNNRSITPPPKAPPAQPQQQHHLPPQLQPQEPYQYFAQQPIDQSQPQLRPPPLAPQQLPQAPASNFSQSVLPPPPTMYPPPPPTMMMPPTQQHQPHSSPMDPQQQQQQHLQPQAHPVSPPIQPHQSTPFNQVHAQHQV